MPSRSRLGLAVSVLTRFLVCAAILGGATALYVALVATRPVLSGDADARPKREVVVFAPRATPVQRQWSGYGTVRPYDEAVVPARVSAVVLEVPDEIRPGRKVEAGELLALLDDHDFRQRMEMAAGALAEIDAQLARLEVEEASWAERARLAEADAELARSDLARVQEAVARDAAKVREAEAAQQRVHAAERQAVAAREELDKIPARRAGLEAMRVAQEASRRLAEQEIARCRVASPIAGVLASVDVNAGESVQPGQRIAHVVRVDRLETPLLLPAAARAAVRVGDEVTLFEDSPLGAREQGVWRAKVERISPDDDPATRTMAVFAVLDQPDGDGPRLAPGRFVHGVVVCGQAAPRIVVPRRSVRSDRLFVVNDGRVVQREVSPEFTVRATLPELGLPDTEWVVLRDPLPEGDLVVLDAARSLPVGVAVAPVPHPAPEHRADADPPTAPRRDRRQRRGGKVGRRGDGRPGPRPARGPVRTFDRIRGGVARTCKARRGAGEAVGAGT